MSRITRIVIAGFSLLLAAYPAHAANEIQPGLWQETETSEVNGKMEAPKVSTDCVSPEDAKDPVKQVQASMKDQAQQCKKLNVRQNGNVILFEMNCGDPNQGSIELMMTYTIHSPQRTSSIAKSTMSMMGKKIVSNVATESKWLAAACKK